MLPTDLFFLLGDAIYADFPFNWFSGYEDLYLKLVQDVHVRDFTRRVPTFAMYDDHEIWDNWSGMEQEPFPTAVGNWSFFLGARNPP